MKKVCLLVVVMLCALSMQAQQVELKEIKELTFFGVDFSIAQVFGAAETADQFEQAFEGINGLFLSEPKKYSPTQAFPKVDITESYRMVNSLNLERVYETLKRDDNEYELTDEMIAEQVASYDTGDYTEGYGAILIAGLMNKPQNMATYHKVVFDLETKEVISNKRITTKAGGFGLRNYWAGSVAKALKSK
ncbi:ATP-dependent helicase YprA (DUF1998 family) [Parabacteroides sp. PFB2-12]|uniref:hypothetical protein n=1 Tax=unclassified Parabacteroides TaxID=2649774 RepID=UPI002474BF91|nr:MULTISPECIES: hypothetical protein [unclassified Parabacteroides]MDH6341683.1 ATP-dependent helicase YprA (DUF1998 family) [Parabacteroides sp. PM6-13]MDH6389894.1 ATP-dependent helicase YprA (DUF1998 family) [Parabacteroides sp. PFB2-12]